MARIDILAEDAMSEEQRRVYDAIRSGPRGRVNPPFMAWLRSPAFADRAQSLGAFLRYGTSLPRRLSELAILVTAHHWDCAYEWDVHARDAAAAGLAATVIDAIGRGETPADMQADEAAVHAYGVAMHRHHRVDDATFRAAVAAIGLPGVVELNGVLGYYSMMAMTLNGFEIGPLGG